MTKERRRLLAVIMIAAILLLALGTYAYFTADISGNPDYDNIIESTGTLEIEYLEGQTIDADLVRPGWTGTKTFTVKNIGTLPVNYDVIFVDIVNTIINDEIILRGTCTSNIDQCSPIEEMVIETEDFTLKHNITIEPNEEHAYEIDIEFIETGENQDYNIKTTLSGKITIVETNAF